MKKIKGGKSHNLATHPLTTWDLPSLLKFPVAGPLRENDRISKRTKQGELHHTIFILHFLAFIDLNFGATKTIITLLFLNIIIPKIAKYVDFKFLVRYLILVSMSESYEQQCQALFSRDLMKLFRLRTDSYKSYSV